MNPITHKVFRILTGAWRRRYVIALPILILPLLGFMLGMFSPKHYASHTSMLIQETAKMNPFLEDLAVSSMLKERMAALQTLLHSRHILGAVAEERGYITADTSPKEYDKVIVKLSQDLSVKLAGKDLIRIDLKSRQPDGMRETLDTVSRHFIEQLLAPERSSMKGSSLFLAEQLKTRRLDLDQTELSLAEFKDKHSDELPELHLANITRRAQLKQRLSERQAELAGATKSLGSLDSQLSKTNPIVGKIEEKIIKIRGDLALWKTRYTDSHSKIQGAMRELRRLESERQHTFDSTKHLINTDQLWDIATSASVNQDNEVQPLLISQLTNLQLAQSKVESLKAEILSLKVMVNELKQQTKDFGHHERDLNKLERDLEVKRELYKDLLQRHEMARVTGSLSIFEQEKRVKIIDMPYTPVNPSNPSIYLFIIAGLIGGLFLGSGLAVILEITDTSLRRCDQLQALTNVKVISRIPAILASKENVLCQQ
jgi:polysaccharide chain length determinant protein (PEP-CTERM system associated)